MARLSDANRKVALEIISRYPRPKSALIPLLHLAQEQDGHVSEEAMADIADLVGCTPAEVIGTSSFYEMLKPHPVGRYVLNVCTDIACQFTGGPELLEHLEETLGIQAGATTADGQFTLEDVECIAACTEAPCLQANYRYFTRLDHDAADRMVDDLRSGALSADVPEHGTLARIRQRIPADRRAGNALPEGGEAPPWFVEPEAEPAGERVTAPVRIVSARFDDDRGHTLDRYLETGGYRGLAQALTMAPDAVTAEVKTASLLGRGGAGFPAGVKWGFCPEGVWPRYVVVNGDESEPGTYKDRVLMERDPHQIIEGALICAYAVAASQVFLYVRGEMALAQERIAQALNDAYEAGWVGREINGSDFSCDVVLHWGAGAYIVGEETALIESLEGERGMPRLKPPFFPAAKGLYQQPTIVNNIETVANLPWIVQNGGQAFADLGAESSRGTRLFAISGHVERPGVYEVEFGTTTYRDLLMDPELGGGIRDGNELKCFIPGGASAPWFFPEHLDIPLEAGAVGEAGSMMGSGAVVVMDETTDAVRACWRVVRFFARESCGKCTPCREGTSWMEKILRRILDGHGRPSDLDLLLDVCDNISPGLAWPPRMTTICPLGPSAVSPVMSALDRFRDEFQAYLDAAEPYDDGTEAGTVRSGVPVTLGSRPETVTVP